MPVEWRLNSKYQTLKTIKTMDPKEVQTEDFEVLDGTDLILSIDGKALAYSSTCKISTQAETGERLHKERGGGAWKEKFVKSFSESITAEGMALRNADAEHPAYDQLKDAMLAKKPVTAHYGVRDGEGREGKAAGGYSGKFVITSLELDGPAGDDAKYSVSLENSGAVTKVSGGNGLTDAAVAGQSDNGNSEGYE